MDSPQSIAEEVLDLPGIALPGVVRIGARATEIDRSPEMLERARAIMARSDAILLPGALEPKLLETIISICRRGPYKVEHIDGVGFRTIEDEDLAGQALRFALSRADFLRWIEAVTDCDALAHITGVVAEMAAGSGQNLGWHNDRNDRLLRRFAITVSLSDRPYEGGLFEMREKQTGRMMVREGALEPGSITLFRIDKRLQHRVTAVDSGGPRRVFAGWLSVPPPADEPGDDGRH